MRLLAKDVYLLGGFPHDAVNVYLIGDVLIDAGTRWDTGRVLRQLRGRTVNAHALTHVHPDHQGASQAVVQALQLPFWVAEADVAAAESGSMASQFPQPHHPLVRFQERFLAGSGVPVDRALREGDDVAGFTVIETPGHTPGHVSFFRERDGVLILGDVLGNTNMRDFSPGLATPLDLFTVDPARNRASARKVAALQPSLILFGHGSPEYDGGRFAEFVAGLDARSAPSNVKSMT